MNRYSFAGKGNILIKAGAAGNYGSSSFAAGEPIAYFTDVSININFAYADKIARTGTQNLIANSTSDPSFLLVDNIKSTDSLQSLLYKKQTNITKSKTIINYVNSNNGVLYLPIQFGEVLTGEIFIYNSDKTKITNFTLEDISTGKITGLSDGKFTVFYTVQKNSLSTFSLVPPTFPYVSIEVQVEGNLNGLNGDAVVRIGKAQLMTRPSLDFANDNPFINSLEFAIIPENDVQVDYYG